MAKSLLNSLPSLDALKAQATRLSAYLGDTHRFRLKAASSLEAIAAIYGQADWNTLRALANRADLAVSGAAPVATEGFHLTADLRVSRSEWLRHTLAMSEFPAERDAWLEQQLYASIGRGGGVFVFPGEDCSAVTIERVQASADAAKVSFNLLSGLDVDAAVSILLTPVGQGDAQWLLFSQAMLRACIEMLRAVGVVVTPQALLALFECSRDELEARARRSDPALGANPVGWTEDASGAMAREVMRAHLRKLSSERWSALFSEEKDAFGLLELAAQAAAIRLRVPNDGHAAQVLLAAVRSLVPGGLARNSDGLAPWALGLGDCHASLPNDLIAIVQQARSAQIAVLLTADPYDLHRQKRHAGDRGHQHQAGVQKLLANCYNLLYLGGLSDTQQAEWHPRCHVKDSLIQADSLRHIFHTR